MITLIILIIPPNRIKIKQISVDFRQEDISGLSEKFIFARNMPIWEPAQMSTA